jgi:hypothetical protein
MAINPETRTESKTQTYALGALGGAFVGMIAAYLYSRAREEERGGGGEVQPLQVGQMITIGLALLGLIRQITEMGRPTTAKRRR